MSVDGAESVKGERRIIGCVCVSLINGGVYEKGEKKKKKKKWGAWYLEKKPWRRRSLGV